VRRIRVQLPATLVIATLLLMPHLAEANTRSQQHYAKGLIPFQAGQWQSAYASFTNATKRRPHDAVARYYRGIAGATSAFVQESIADLEAALQIRPDLAKRCSTSASSISRRASTSAPSRG
jgi:Flp pilus assembly protein TadD